VSRNPAPSVLARTPLRVQLVVALLVLVTLGLAVTGVVATTQLRGYLVAQVDQDLAGDIPQSLQGPQPGDERSPFGAGRPEWLRVTTLTGVPVFGDRQTEPDTSPPAISRAQILAAGRHPFTVPAVSGGGHWRVGVQRAAAQNFGQVLAVRAISLNDVDGTVGRLVLLEVLVGTAVLVLLGGVGFLVIRRSLRPLGEVEATAAEIAAGDLSRRVPERDPRTEVGRLSQAFNAMLGQIETAFRAREASESSALASEHRMRRFVADASHELRTPLTSIRGFAELYRQGGVPSGEELDRVMRRVEDEAARMGLLVEDLLLLARLDQQRPIELAPVDLIGVLGDVVHDTRVLAPDREISLSIEGDAAPVVLGDEDRLRQVVTNLVSNAITHTPNGSPVAVGLAVGPGLGAGTALVSVTDHGPGMSEEARGKVFERFYRADPSRTRAAGGSGLGLSIVAALVAAHGGRVGVQSALGSGSRFLVELPLMDPREPEHADEVLAAGPAAGSQAGHRFPGETDSSNEPAPPAHHPA
jgi:two-component system, OmpR family, sensor kinase